MTNQLQEDKWVRVMADFAANGIWCKSGTMAELSDLQDYDIAFDLGGWQSWFEDTASDQPIEDMDRFVACGMRIVWAIKKRHPDWTVVYFDESRDQNVIATRLWFERA